MPDLVFVCPFNLDRTAGTPLRARTTIEAVGGAFSTAILATGGNLHGVEVIERAWLRREGRPDQFRMDRFGADVFRHLKVLKPRIIHAFTTPSYPPALAYKLMHRSVKLVFESHGLAKLEALGANPLYRGVSTLIDAAGVRWADDLILMSHSQQKYYSQAFSRGSAGTHVIWGPVDTKRIQVTAPPPAPPVVFGYLGGKSHWQGTETILSAARLLAESSPEIAFRLAGVDPKDLPGDIPRNIEVLGPIPTERGDRFLQECHALLSTRVCGPVAQVQYPQKLSHYLAAGRPVVASEVSDQAEIVRRAGCGLTYPAQDSQALASQIKAMSRLSSDERARMGLNAKRFADEHLSVGSLAIRLGEIYAGSGKARLSRGAKYPAAPRS